MRQIFMKNNVPAGLEELPFLKLNLYSPLTLNKIREPHFLTLLSYDNYRKLPNTAGFDNVYIADFITWRPKILGPNRIPVFISSQVVGN